MEKKKMIVVVNKTTGDKKEFPTMVDALAFINDMEFVGEMMWEIQEDVF
jgi:hypothetical protein